MQTLTLGCEREADIKPLGGSQGAPARRFKGIGRYLNYPQPQLVRKWELEVLRKEERENGSKPQLVRKWELEVDKVPDLENQSKSQLVRKWELEGHSCSLQWPR